LGGLAAQPAEPPLWLVEVVEGPAAAPLSGVPHWDGGFAAPTPHWDWLGAADLGSASGPHTEGLLDVGLLSGVPQPLEGGLFAELSTLQLPPGGFISAWSPHPPPLAGEVFPSCPHPGGATGGMAWLLHCCGTCLLGAPQASVPACGTGDAEGEPHPVGSGLPRTWTWACGGVASPHPRLLLFPFPAPPVRHWSILEFDPCGVAIFFCANRGGSSLTGKLLGEVLGDGTVAGCSGCVHLSLAVELPGDATDAFFCLSCFSSASLVFFLHSFSFGFFSALV